MTGPLSQSEKHIRKKASEHRAAARALREQAEHAVPAQRARHIDAAERFEALAEELERGFQSDHPVHMQQIFR